MKKALSLALALVMALSLSVGAFAADTIESDGGSKTGDVKVTVKDLVSSGTVYYVVVEWGTLSFTYNKGNQGVWQPGSHSYAATTGAGWVTGKDGEGKDVVADTVTASIKVTNHSNAAVNTTATFAEGSDSATKFGVTAQISNAVNLATAEGTAVASAPSGTYTVSISGTPNEDWTAENNVVGTITVKISAAT